MGAARTAATMLEADEGAASRRDVSSFGSAPSVVTTVASESTAVTRISSWRYDRVNIGLTVQ